ncbi:MAG: hypothetical protein KOO62_11420 [candidate division Zixibacteria bacterium]|nr:hypothetical protein [candidate division Zixibacteria bacterium]
MNMSIVVRLFLIVGVISLVLLGCSSENETEETVSVAESTLSPQDAELAAILNDALVRLSYEDKSGLYELEFDYFLDEYDFDHYVKRGDIMWIHMDSLDHLAVHSIVHFDDDSAHAQVEYVFNSAAGGQSRLPDKFTIYRSNGRWVKPAITTLRLQGDYDRTIREAEAAASEEN